MRTKKHIIHDCHNHLVDFLQETDGLSRLLEKMNEHGIDHSMINGMMVMKKWEDISQDKPHYYLDDDSKCYWYSATDLIVAMEVLKLPQKGRRRFHPAICGFNPTDKNAIDHVKRMVNYFPDVWHGIGEIMTRHDDLTALTYGETSRANHPALNPIYQFAQENDLPVYLHSNISSVTEKKPIYLHELEETLHKHKRTRIIWAHCGISRRILVPNLIEHLEKLLKSYDSLYMDLSWVVYDSFLIEKEKVVPEWLALINAFPEKFMIGSDHIGHFDEYKEFIDRYSILLDTLKPEISKRVARDNFVSILPKKVQSENFTS